ncbi:hypothetical protein SAMN04488056_102172 [Cohaesibacter marisflavi]|uniref:Uncharacterized protein n=1 Tax=Cohaesibacter marisflavi TaxID=655353 RepID=A0A1I5CAI4_9HYPH|nr:hypothetical protein [Cohaesibacter marisflavi]SFN84018.1 hypothetical protein SAMN04488056_102172 [Cohaesibacter marisflavi]
MRYALLAIWIGAVSTLSAYVSGHWMNNKSFAELSGIPLQEGMDFEKTRAISVPMITDGKVRGYIVAQFVYTIDSTTLRELAIPPNPFIVDEAFRTIFNDTSIDFDDLKAYDIDKLTTHIKDSVNQRMQAKLVHDILVEEFSFFPDSSINKS